MNRTAAPASDRPAIESSRRSAFVAAGSMLATGVVLAAAFFPMLFNHWASRDDEGLFVFGLREFVNHHGSFYSTIWSDMYGPFYYLTMSTVFRVIHQQPSLENGRWIVLILTTASAALFGASVWRVTKSVPGSLLCETAAFLILIHSAGNEPMHPGSLGVLLVAVVAFELSSYAASRRTVHLVAIGAATGALTMTKVNAGGLVAVAVVFALFVGSQETPRRMQFLIAGLAALVPIALVSQNISETWAATLASVVVISIVGMFVVMSIDQLSLPRGLLLPIASGGAAAVVCSLAFPVLTGTPLSAVTTGVFIRPLALPNAFTLSAHVKLEWFILVLTVAGIYAAVAFRSLSAEVVKAWSGWLTATLAALALWLLGLGVTVFTSGATVASWLPAIVLLPALAYWGGSSESIRFALRSAVLLATLQVLVVYPVAGSQVSWGTVAMVVPCAIALAAAVDRNRVWREAGLFVRSGTTAVLCLALVVASGAWPPDTWKTYLDNPRLGLPGAGLMRIDPTTTATLQAVTQSLRAHCDTFYGVPDENSLYIFSGIPAVTAMAANAGIGGLTAEQRDKVVQALRAKTAAKERVCILRDASQEISLPRGTLASALREYSSVVATVGSYTISRHS